MREFSPSAEPQALDIMACVFFRYRLWAVVVAVLLVSGCARPPRLKRLPPLQPGELPIITVIPGGEQSYWLEARRGAEDAAKKLGAHIQWKVPRGQDAAALQGAMVETAATNSHAVAVAPIDSTKLMRHVAGATKAGLAVVVFNRDVYTLQNKLTYIRTDEEKKTDLQNAVNSGAKSGTIQPDYYQMGYQSVKAILDFRALKDVPREIKIAPRLITKKSVKKLTHSIGEPN